MFQRIKARLWALSGNSRTLFVGYATEVLAVLDEAQIIDWSSLFGVEKGGRILAVMGLVIIGMRLITSNAVDFHPQTDENVK